MDNDITVLIPTSPIHSHPSTAIIDETIDSIRLQLPTSEIIVMVDGVRPEQEGRRADYDEYQRRLLWKCNHAWTNVRCKIFTEFSHQVRMTTKTIPEITTPILLFVEHDMPLMADRTFQWNECADAIKTGDANLVRFCMEPYIIDAWQHMMLDQTPVTVCGAPMLRTCQWSQRVHLASVAFYRELLDRYFDDRSRTFMEDRLHGPAAEAYSRDGVMGWLTWRLWIYAPPGDIQRFYTTDGRGDEPKYDMIF